MSDTTFRLTLSCRNTPGIVAAVSQFLDERGADIEDARQFDDRITKSFFKAGDRLRIWASPNRNPNDNRVRIKRMERRSDKWKWGGNRIETR